MNSAKLFLAFRPLLCFSILLVCVLVADAGSRSAHSAPTKTRKQPFLETVDRVAPQSLKEFAVPGVAVGLIQKGEVAWARGYGFANVATAKPITPETVFNVGSLSKMATAWGVMRLVEEGKVDLDRPVDSYLKRWHLPPSSFDNSQVTVRRVLSHTSGISNHNFHGWDPQSPVPPIHERRIGIFGCVSHQLSAFVRSIGFKDCPSYLQNASTSGPSGDVALEEGSEIVSAGWEFFSSVADPREIQVYDGIDQAT